MTKNANGGDISRIASSLVDSQKVTTQMPCVNYKTLHAYLLKFINRSAVGSDGGLGNEFINGCYRHAETAKLLQLLGYGNFPEQFANFKVNNDKDNKSGLNFIDVTYKNSPYLSIFVCWLIIKSVMTITCTDNGSLIMLLCVMLIILHLTVHLCLTLMMRFCLFLMIRVKLIR